MVWGPQVSALSPTLFNIYILPLAQMGKSYNITLVSYADDTQLVTSFSNNSMQNLAKFQEDMAAIAEWMAANCLQLNSSKSEIPLLGRYSFLWGDHWWPPALGSPPQPTMAVKYLVSGSIMLCL